MAWLTCYSDKTHRRGIIVSVGLAIYLAFAVGVPCPCPTLCSATRADIEMCHRDRLRIVKSFTSTTQRCAYPCFYSWWRSPLAGVSSLVPVPFSCRLKSQALMLLRRPYQLFMGSSQHKDTRRAHDIHGHRYHVRQPRRPHRHPALPSLRRSVVPARLVRHRRCCRHGFRHVFNCECAILPVESAAAKHRGC